MELIVTIAFRKFFLSQSTLVAYWIMGEYNSMQPYEIKLSQLIDTVVYFVCLFVCLFLPFCRESKSAIDL